MSIDTAQKRQTAMIDPWGMLIPDGVITTPFEAWALIGQYSVGDPDPGLPIGQEREGTLKLGTGRFVRPGVGSGRFQRPGLGSGRHYA